MGKVWNKYKYLGRVSILIESIRPNHVRESFDHDNNFVCARKIVVGENLAHKPM